MYDYTVLTIYCTQRVIRGRELGKGALDFGNLGYGGCVYAELGVLIE